jgi:cytochrome c-type biogenesis protein CcsB
LKPCLITHPDNATAMDKLLKRIFSMSLMTVTLLLFFIAIAVATFVENDFGTPVAQKVIYKSNWFAAILIYLSLSLIYNIYRYQMIQLKKFGTILFHVALLVIVIGAGITRKYGFEGVMTIREGASSNYIITRDTYIQIKVHDFDKQYTSNEPIIIDTNVYNRLENGKPDYSHNYFKHEFEFPEQQDPIAIEFVDLIPSVKDTLIPEVGGKTYIDLVTGGMTHNYLESGKIMNDGGIRVAFNNLSDSGAVNIFTTDSGIFVLSPIELSYFQMSDMTTGVVKADSVQIFHTKRAYTANGFTFVFSQYYPSAFLESRSMKSPNGEPSAVDGVVVNVSQGALKTQVTLRGGSSVFPTKEVFQLGDLNYELAYGSRIIELPFSIFLRDFQLERYPGGQSPASYASEVTVIDHLTGKQFDHRIYMNNVLDYGGYRFFQSNYEPDEMGTILSVNHDAAGTWVTYIGYLLLGLGFVVNLLTPSSRFRHLIKKSKELKEKMSLTPLIAILFALFFSVQASAKITRTVDPEHAERFGHLIIQDLGGRFKPVHTMATELLRKIYRADEYEGHSAMQVYLGIITNFEEWNLEPIIQIPGARYSDFITGKLNLPKGTKYACIQDFITLDGTYILAEEVTKAHQKREGSRNQYDKDLLKIDERFNVALGVFYGFYFKIFPLPGDVNHTWVSPFDEDKRFSPEDGEFVQSITKAYFQGVFNGYQSGNWTEADLALSGIEFFQRRVSDPKVIPSAEKIEWEIRYNKMNLFKRLNYIYLLLGVVLLLFNLAELFSRTFSAKWILRIGHWIFLICFLAHGSGLALRWYLSGHAPWSNGYEAVVFIAFITVLAGLLFYKQNKIILGATGILAWLMLFVAHMNELDPEITNLVPVLQSYWLMIHVAIITGSYGFLGLAAILALVNLIMFVFIKDSNKTKINDTSRQLTYVIEMTMIIGLFMLTIGTFLGGVWANESWGRYWGWDAKETWALASVLVYAIILHFRFIPGLKSHFAMTTAALWGYGSIIMTFFGVNFYLSGLHSYAQGDPIPIPTWVPITVILLFALNILAYLRYRTIFKTQ